MRSGFSRWPNRVTTRISIGSIRTPAASCRSTSSTSRAACARPTLKGPFEVTANRAFEEVVAGCAEPAPGRRQTWINDTIFDLCRKLHVMGYAHSVETWLDGELVGGLYGVALGGAFFGESMFSRETDASKVALVHLVARLKRGGFTLLDTQFVTKHLERFGAVEISRDVYRKHLTEALKHRASFPAHSPEEALLAVLD